MSRSDARGLLLVISGPSGVGKTTVVDGLLATPGFCRVVTATTRPPRPGEVDGVHYRFLDETAFRDGIARDRFLEWAQVHGSLYGTPRDAVDQVLTEGDVCLLNIDVQGAHTLRQAATDGLFVFLVAPSWEELERRLRARGSDRPEEVERRLAGARAELERQGEYDAVVINGDIEETIGQIRGLALSRRG